MTCSAVDNYSFKIRQLSGFSLLEFLLAIALLTSVSALLSTIIFQTDKAKQFNAKRLQNRQELRLIKNFIERDLKNIVYLPNFADVGQTGIYGINRQEGEVELDQIYMHVHQSSLNNALTDEGFDPKLHEINYYLRSNNNEENLFSLYRREKFYISQNFQLVENIFEGEPPNNDQKLHVSLISDRVSAFKIEYIGNDNDLIQEWESSSKGSDKKLPLAVVVNITLLDKDDKTQEISFQTNIRTKIQKTVWNF